MPAPVRIAILTPPGRGAVATLRVVGDGAVDAVVRHLLDSQGRPRPTLPNGRVIYGRWGSAQGEEVVVCRRGTSVHTSDSPSGPQGRIIAAPVQTSGELQSRAYELVDIHCHGGSAATAAIVASLTADGARELPWREHCLLPEAGQTTDLAIPEAREIAREALSALAEATTLRAASILLDQWHGAVAREIAAIEQLLAGEFSALEDHPPRDNVSLARQRLETLRSRARLGRHLVTPWRVVLTGRPNVGKSSLINALLGYQRSIVFDQPGTTRDLVTAQAALNGWPVELTDTAGLRSGGDELEAAGVAKALDQVAAADLVVEVRDLTEQASSAEFGPVVELTRREPALVVWNKCDLVPRPWNVAAPGDSVFTSTVTRQGIDQLAQRIAQRLVPSPPPPGSAVPFTDRQLELLKTLGARMANDQRPMANLTSQIHNP